MKNEIAEFVTDCTQQAEWLEGQNEDGPLPVITCVVLQGHLEAVAKLYGGIALRTGATNEMSSFLKRSHVRIERLERETNPLVLRDVLVEHIKDQRHMVQALSSAGIVHVR